MSCAPLPAPLSKPTHRFHRRLATISIDHEHKLVGDDCPQSDQREARRFRIVEDGHALRHLQQVGVTAQCRVTRHGSMHTHGGNMLRDRLMANLQLPDPLQRSTGPPVELTVADREILPMPCVQDPRQRSQYVVDANPNDDRSKRFFSPDSGRRSRYDRSGRLGS